MGLDIPNIGRTLRNLRARLRFATSANSCALTLSATDSKGGHCTAAVINITPTAGNTTPTAANISLVCNDGDGVVINHGEIGSISGLATVTACGTNDVHTCAGIANYVADPVEVANRPLTTKCQWLSWWLWFADDGGTRPRAVTTPAI